MPKPAPTGPPKAHPPRSDVGLLAFSTDPLLARRLGWLPRREAAFTGGRAHFPAPPTMSVSWYRRLAPDVAVWGRVPPQWLRRTTSGWWTCRIRPFRASIPGADVRFQPRLSPFIRSRFAALIPFGYGQSATVVSPGQEPFSNPQGYPRNFSPIHRTALPLHTFVNTSCTRLYTVDTSTEDCR